MVLEMKIIKEELRFEENLKKRLEQQKQKLENANKQTKKLDNSSKGIIELLDNLKPMPFNKNNSQISNENIENIKDYIKDVTDVTQTVRSVNDLNMSIKEFEHATSKIESENYSLKEKTIIKLSNALEKSKTELCKFKGFWKSLIKRFQMKIFDEKYYDIPEDKRSYTLVAEDLEKSGIFDNNDSDIVHNPTRKVLTNEELAEIQAKKGKKKNDYNLN